MTNPYYRPPYPTRKVSLIPIISYISRLVRQYRKRRMTRRMLKKITQDKPKY